MEKPENGTAPPEDRDEAEPTQAPAPPAGAVAVEVSAPKQRFGIYTMVVVMAGGDGILGADGLPAPSSVQIQLEIGDVTPERALMIFQLMKRAADQGLSNAEQIIAKQTMERVGPKNPFDPRFRRR